MTLVGLDLNSSRARAVAGPALQSVGLVQLEGKHFELPLAISLQERQPRVGQAGFALTRSSPSQALDFLPSLGSNRQWKTRQHTLDASTALGLVFRELAHVVGNAEALAFSLPSYLDAGQIDELYHLAFAAQLPLAGSLASPLAAVLSSPLAHEASGQDLLLVIDIDGYALTWSVIERSPDQLRLRLVQTQPQLARGLWHRKLLDGIANRCVRHSRRDPRDSAETEQGLYEQLLHALDQTGNKLVQVEARGRDWFHHLMFHIEEMTALVVPLLRQAISDLETVLGTIDSLGRLRGVLVTHAASAVPGLVAAVRAQLAHQNTESEDYGDRLSGMTNDLVHILPVDALACMAHEQAIRIHNRGMAGGFPRGHLEAVALVTSGGKPIVEEGPARLSFRGQDHVLPGQTFVLGRDPSCDLVFESALYPHVSARHCEIIRDQRSFLLCDRSRHGTLLNDRPVPNQAALHSGDWIRLGPRGPVLRFLGQAEQRR